MYYSWWSFRAWRQICDFKHFPIEIVVNSQKIIEKKINLLLRSTCCRRVLRNWREYECASFYRVSYSFGGIPPLGWRSRPLLRWYDCSVSTQPFWTKEPSDFQSVAVWQSDIVWRIDPLQDSSDNLPRKIPVQIRPHFGGNWHLPRRDQYVSRLPNQPDKQ